MCEGIIYRSIDRWRHFSAHTSLSLASPEVLIFEAPSQNGNGPFQVGWASVTVLFFKLY